ncbi:hypothetical protein [Actinomadura luteofluorescens]|uniref:hypothetical protein n=1 Tax=Actinomadura luteofluorescens TaxID=46163 RepID=UPI003D92F4F3
MSSSGDRLRQMAERADRGAAAAAGAMAREAKDGIQATLARRSHARGTPTPSPAGQPPAKISGRLKDHVIVVRARQEGAHRFVAAAGPRDVVYARIQEKGGVAGRGHRSTLPPRPYVLPTVVELRASGRLREVSIEAFQAVVHGR